MVRLEILLYYAIFITYGSGACPGIVSRSEWDAVDPVHVRYVTRPVNIVIIQHTVTSACDSIDSCGSILRMIQSWHMDNLEYWDIASSFFIGGDANIYEGTGWLHAGYHTIDFNEKSIAISFIGNYNKQNATEAQLNAVKELLKCGVERGHLTPQYKVVGQRQVMATEGPGVKLFNAIRRWPQWLEDVDTIKKKF